MTTYEPTAITIEETAERTPELVCQLLAVWERPARATHLLLSSSKIEDIKHYVPHALSSVAHLIVAKDEPEGFLGFMGVEDDTLEMLFLAPEAQGGGLGRHLLECGMQHHHVRRLAANEQNPQAKGFYEHMGFRVYKRTALANRAILIRSST